MSSPRSSARASRRRSGSGRRRRCRPRAPSSASCASTFSTRRRSCSTELGRPDALIHLAWGGLPNYQSLHHYEQELPAHYRLLKDLVGDGLTNLVVAGTCFEYGMQSGPLGETMAAVPANPYALAKDTLRQQLQLLQRELPFALTWARLFYLHGEGQAQTALLPQLRQVGRRRRAAVRDVGRRAAARLPAGRAGRRPSGRARRQAARARRRQRLLGPTGLGALAGRRLDRREPTGRSGSTSAAIPIPPTSRWRSGATTRS